MALPLAADTPALHVDDDDLVLLDDAAIGHEDIAKP